MSFEPRQVNPLIWRDWVRKAIAMQTEVWISNIVLTGLLLSLAVVILKYAHWLVGLAVMAIAAPCLVAVFVLNALRSQGYCIGQYFTGTKIRDWLWLALAGLSGWVIFAGFLLLLLVMFLSIGWLAGFDLFFHELGYDSSVRVPGSGYELEYPYLFFVGILFIVMPLAAFYAQSLVRIMSSWFVVPLILLMGFDIRMAYRFSVQAEQLNPMLVNTVTILSLGCLSVVLFSGGVLAVIILPFLGALHLVSFVDVFFGCSEFFSARNVKSVELPMDSRQAGGLKSQVRNTTKIPDRGVLKFACLMPHKKNLIFFTLFFL